MPVTAQVGAHAGKANCLATWMHVAYLAAARKTSWNGVKQKVREPSAEPVCRPEV